MLKRSTWLLVLAVLLVFVVTPVFAAEYDLNGRTIRIAGHEAEGMKAYFESGDGRGRIELVEEAFNAKIEFVPLTWEGAVDSMLTSIIAGDPVGDLLFINNRWLPQLAGQGAILSLDDVLTDEYYASLPGSHSKMRELYSTFQGKAYGISLNGSFPRNMDIGSGQGWIYNKAMLEEEGLEDLYELQRRGEWTWDVMKEYAIRLTKDTDGDGKIDQYGVGGRLDPWPVEQELFAYANGGGIMKYDENGRAVYALNDPAAVEAVELWKELDQVHGAVMVGDLYNVREEFNRGNVAMFRLDLFGLPDHAQQVDFEYGWVFIPKGPRVDDYVNPVWGFDMFVLPITEKEPEALVALVDMLFETTGKYRDLDNYEEEFVEYFMPFVHDWDSLDTIRDMLNKAVLWDNIDLSENARMALVRAAVESGSAQSELDAIAPEVQAALDSLYNK